MSILYITCAENGLIGLERLLRRGLSIDRVVTISKATAEKNAVSGFVDVGPFCSNAGIPVSTLEGYRLTREDVKEADFDAVVVNGWNRLLDAPIIKMARLGAVGVHAGHPPIGLGRAPLVWNILLGKSDIEVYTFLLSTQADDGDILACRPVEITAHDNVRTLYEKVAVVGADLIYEAIEKLRRGERGIPQNLDFAIHYQKRTPADGLIDFRMSETEIYNFVRAQSRPYPGAFSYLLGKRWYFHRVMPFDRFAFRNVRREPGLIVDVLPSGLVILTGGAPIWLLEADVDGALRVPLDMTSDVKLIGQRFGQLVVPVGEK